MFGTGFLNRFQSGIFHPTQDEAGEAKIWNRWSMALPEAATSESSKVMKHVESQAHTASALQRGKERLSWIEIEIWDRSAERKRDVVMDSLV
jgi:hypothetical protein